MVSTTTIYVAYQILKEDKLYDLCEVLQCDILRNITKIEQDKESCIQIWHFDSTLVVESTSTKWVHVFKQGQLVEKKEKCDLETRAHF